ncbi:hypothetical protein [Candidatus Solirubrobacter pratensis]|uniref:hypothetical protein n=1 Tax=Candidatus Solirubrobacter pratensis TaxID=1298857 RepID=UPI000484D3EB|nr:hypothetical protein [Candidatus Solirubrobacter pratensis]
MELVRACRVLARHRILLLLGALAAGVAALSALGVVPAGPGGAPVQTAGAARTRLLIDTPNSLITDLRARADIIGPQAALLGDLLAAPQQSDAIERDAGLQKGSLVVLRPPLTAPVAPSTLDEDAAAVAGAAGVSTLTITTSTALPIVTLNAVAPTRADAARLTATAAKALAAVAASRAPDPASAFTVRPLGGVRSIAITAGGGSRIPVAVVAGVMTFLFWCGGMIVALGLLRALRTPPRTAPAKAVS